MALKREAGKNLINREYAVTITNQKRGTLPHGVARFCLCCVHHTTIKFYLFNLFLCV